MSARWTERQDGRNAGRTEQEPAGCPVLLVLAVILLAALFFAVQVLLWVVRAVTA